MADELQTIQNFVFSRLANDATLANLIGGAVNPRIFVGVAKQTTLFPFILIEYVSPATAFSDAGLRSFGSGDFYRVGTIRTWTTHRWRVTARTNTRDMGAISAIASRIDVLLHITDGTEPAGIFSSIRENPYQRTEAIDNVIYSIKGGDFIITAN
jgi:hypothetical protein